MKVALFRTDAIGDTLLTLPLAQSLKEQKISQKVYFLASNRARDLFPYSPWVDDYQILELNWTWWQKLNFCLEHLKTWKPDAIVYVGGTSAPVVAAFLLGIRIRLGLKSRWWTHLLLNKGIRQKRSKGSMHEVQWNHDLLSPLGLDSSKLSAPMTKLHDEAVKKSENISKDWSNRPLILVHPGMSGHSLNWPMKNYAALMSKIEDQFPQKFKFVVSHTPSDGKYIIELKQYLQKANLTELHFFEGSQHGLPVFMALAQKSELFIGPSTGTTHLANSLKVPQVTFYGPIKAQSAVRWGPFVQHEKCWVFSPQVHCPVQSKCLLEKCSFYECMSTITVDQVMDKIRDHLQG